MKGAQPLVLNKVNWKQKITHKNYTFPTAFPTDGKTEDKVNFRITLQQKVKNLQLHNQWKISFLNNVKL